MRPTQFFLVMALIMTQNVSARAADKIAATIDLAHVINRLIFNRYPENGVEQQVKLANKVIRLKFEDPRGHGEIERILFDPNYRPGTNEYADFFLNTTVEDPISKKPWTDGGLCNWTGKEKKIATCVIEDDGGRNQIILEKGGTGPKDGKLMFRILHSNGYDGFRIGSSDNEQSHIDLELKGDKPLMIPVKF